MIKNIDLKKLGFSYHIWSKKNPIGKIPAGVAKEGAGENRIPFAHYANSLPVYLTFSQILKENSKNYASILDIGCGTGRNISFVKDIVDKKNYNFFGIDYSGYCVKFARNQYKKQNVIFTQYEGKILPFPNQSFDFVVSSHVLEHIPKRDGYTYSEEISRVLKKNGVAVIGTPNKKYCQDLFSINPTDEKKFRLILPHEHEYYFKEIKTLFRKNKKFNKLIFYGTTNLINRKLMTEGANNIKPKKGIFHSLKFSIYTLLRSNSFLQDLMAKLGTEYILKKMKVNYRDIIENTTLVFDDNIGDADNFIVIAFVQ
ncbi:MAG: class I SAM-dependent methyltransferase [Cyanobacteria bacterium]|nr:class I SAM-dependent methyltransferase [Cyanobacteriota bacterium]